MDELETLERRVREARWAAIAIGQRNVIGLSPEERSRLNQEYDQACARHIAAIRALESAKHAAAEGERLLATVLLKRKLGLDG